MNSLPNAVFYGRVSTDEQDTHADQLAEVRDFCQRNSEHLRLDENATHYFANDVTGDRYFTNPTYLGLLEYLSFNRHIRYIIVRHSSRFGRAGAQVMEAQRHRLRTEYGIEVLSATEPYLNPTLGEAQVDEWGNCADPTDMVRTPMRAITDTTNRAYRQQIGRESRKAVMRSLEQGRAHGGPPGLFFVRVDTGTDYYCGKKLKRHFVIQPDPSTRHLHQQMFEHFLNTRSLTALAEWLDERGIRTRRGKRIAASTLTTRLRDYKFIGKACYNRYTPKGPGNLAGRRMRDKEYWHIFDNYCEATVSEETFFAVQDVLDTGASILPKGALLTGMARCGSCGRKITVVRSNSYFAYRCASRHDKGAKRCPSVEVQVEDVDRTLSKFLDANIFQEDFLRNFFARELPQLLAGHSDEAKRARAAIEDEIERNRRELAHINSDGVRAVLSKEMIADLRRKREAEIRMYERRLKSGSLSAASPGFEHLTDFSALAVVLREWWEDASLSTKKALLKALISKATLSRNKRSGPWELKLDLVVRLMKPDSTVIPCGERGIRKESQFCPLNIDNADTFGAPNEVLLLARLLQMEPQAAR